MNARNRSATGRSSLGSILALMWDNRRNIVKSRRVIVSIVLALMLGVITESVLLLGYVIAGSSLLLVAVVLLRKALRCFAGSQVPSSRTGWLGVNHRKAA
jgi:hypothetical protein